MKIFKCLHVFCVALTAAVLLAILTFTAAADNRAKSVAYLEFAYYTGDTVAYDICFNDTEGLNIAQFGMNLEYSDNLTLVSCNKVYKHGAFATSGTNPLTVIWAVGDETLPKGKTAVAQVVFELKEELEDGETINLTISFYKDSPPKDNNETDLTNSIEIVPYFENSADDFRCNTNVGDVNSDEKVNVSDVSLLLRYIAKWDGVQIDSEQADVYFDGKVNISDVSMLLKYVAKWNSVRLGHDDMMKINKVSTCQVTGEATLTCKRCGNIEAIDISVIPCKYVSYVEKVPTCGEEGIERHSCEMCGNGYTTPIKKTTNHAYTSTVISNPTCKDRGESKYTCAICGYSRIMYMNPTGKHTYSNGWCIHCDIADWNDTTVDKLQRYANWLKQNGEYAEDCYTYSILVNGTYIVSNIYYPADDLIIVSCMYESDGIVYVGASEFLVCTGKEWWTGWYDTSYAAIGLDGTVYIAGGEEMTPPGFCDRDTIIFEYFESDVYDSYTKADGDHAYALIEYALLASSDILKSSGTGMRWSALGFNF